MVLRRVLAMYDRLLPDEGKGWLVLSVIGSLLIALMDMAGVALTLPLMLVATAAPGAERVTAFTERFGISDTGETIILLACLIGTLFILKSICAIGIRWWQLGKQNRLQAIAATGLLERFAASPYDVHRTRDSADIQRHINFSVPQIFGGVLGGFLTLSVDGLTALLTIGVLTVVSPIGMITAVLVFGTTIGLTQVLLRKKTREIGVQQSELSLVTWSTLLPLVEGFREVRLTGSRTKLIDSHRDARLRGGVLDRNLGVFSELPKYSLEIALILGIGAIAGVLVLTGNPEQTVAVLGVFAAAAGRVTPTLNRISFSFIQIRAASASLEALEEVLPTLPEEIDPPDALGDSAHLDGDLVLSEVGYHYPDTEEWSVRNVSATIPKGTSIAFAGSSGAGKSTLLDLILALFTPSEGTITCGDVNVHENPRAWMHSLGVVSQDVYLLNDTVLANVAFGVPAGEIDHDRVRQAIADAQLEDLVADLPDGLETKLGERGVRISGGQRQRIGIARALYRQPSVLVLDEATSALDNLTEHRISQTVQALAGKLTIIIVAHRLSTIRHVDQVVYMSGGTIAAQGAFEEVAAANEEFAELVELGRLG